MGVVVFPICLSLAMPVLIYNLVLEKEMRLLENMKINGLNIRTYWKVTGVYNLVLYWATCAGFWFCGRYVFDISLFQDTHVMMFVEILALWGLCQVALAFFFSSFMSNSQTGAMTGYGIAIWTVCIGANLTQSVYALPRRMPGKLMFYPTFPFVRAFYLLIDPCTWDTCHGEYHLMPEEFREMEGYLFLNFVVYMVLAAYLQ